MTPTQRAIRTLLQTIAGGGLTALVVAVANGLPPGVVAVVMGAWTALVAFVQNQLEASGTIPPLLGARHDDTARGA